MKRRNFLKLTLAVTSLALVPEYIFATKVDLEKINFSSEQFEVNRQTIIVFLAGGPSPLAGNLSNLDEINASSQQSYSTFGKTYLNKIEGYDLWKEAGGEYMKSMLDNGDMTLFRTCYSASRAAVGNRSHGICTEQNLKGNYDTNNAGMLTSLSRLMKKSNKYNSLNLPFITLNGENALYSGDPANALKPVSLHYNLSNPFNRITTSDIFYTSKERLEKDYNKKESALDASFDNMAKKHNSIDTMNNFLDNRKKIQDTISTVYKKRVIKVNDTYVDKNLDTYGYTANNRFHQSLATAIELLDENSNTRTITLGTDGLGGWDDHSYCRVNYTRRMQNLFKALDASMRHLEGIKKKNKISILVFGEFGRNVNLNNSFGWDHGNLQSLYVLGGTDYFNHAGGKDAIVGETVVDNGGKPKSGRIWLKPKKGTYVCDPISIAATIYALHGVENPKELTGGFDVINPIINGQEFLTL